MDSLNSRTNEIITFVQHAFDSEKPANKYSIEFSEKQITRWLYGGDERKRSISLLEKEISNIINNPENKSWWQKIKEFFYKPLSQDAKNEKIKARLKPLISVLNETLSLNNSEYSKKIDLIKVRINSYAEEERVFKVTSIAQDAFSQSISISNEHGNNKKQEKKDYQTSELIDFNIDSLYEEDHQQKQQQQSLNTQKGSIVHEETEIKAPQERVVTETVNNQANPFQDKPFFSTEAIYIAKPTIQPQEQPSLNTQQDSKDALPEKAVTKTDKPETIEGNILKYDAIQAKQKGLDRNLERPLDKAKHETNPTVTRTNGIDQGMDIVPLSGKKTINPQEKDIALYATFSEEDIITFEKDLLNNLDTSDLSWSDKELFKIMMNDIHDLLIPSKEEVFLSIEKPTVFIEGKLKPKFNNLLEVLKFYLPSFKDIYSLEWFVDQIRTHSIMGKQLELFFTAHEKSQLNLVKESDQIATREAQVSDLGNLSESRTSFFKSLKNVKLELTFGKNQKLELKLMFPRLIQTQPHMDTKGYENELPFQDKPFSLASNKAEPTIQPQEQQSLNTQQDAKVQEKSTKINALPEKEDTKTDKPETTEGNVLKYDAIQAQKSLDRDLERSLDKDKHETNPTVTRTMFLKDRTNLSHKVSMEKNPQKQKFNIDFDEIFAINGIDQGKDIVPLSGKKTINPQEKDIALYATFSEEDIITFAKDLFNNLDTSDLSWSDKELFKIMMNDIHDLLITSKEEVFLSIEKPTVFIEGKLKPKFNNLLEVLKFYLPSFKDIYSLEWFVDQIRTHSVMGKQLELFFTAHEKSQLNLVKESDQITPREAQVSEFGNLSKPRTSFLKSLKNVELELTFGKNQKLELKLMVPRLIQPKPLLDTRVLEKELPSEKPISHLSSLRNLQDNHKLIEIKSSDFVETKNLEKSETTEKSETAIEFISNKTSWVAGTILLAGTFVWAYNSSNSEHVASFLDTGASLMHRVTPVVKNGIELLQQSFSVDKILSAVTSAFSNHENINLPSGIIFEEETVSPVKQKADSQLWMPATMKDGRKLEEAFGSSVKRVTFKNGAVFVGKNYKEDTAERKVSTFEGNFENDRIIVNKTTYKYITGEGVLTLPNGDWIKGEIYIKINDVPNAIWERGVATPQCYELFNTERKNVFIANYDDQGSYEGQFGPNSNNKYFPQGEGEYKFKFKSNQKGHEKNIETNAVAHINNKYIGNYKGSWVDGKKEGKGTWISPLKSQIITGEWKEDVPNGKVTVSGPENQYFEGIYYDGDPYEGKLTQEIGDTIKTIEYHNGRASDPTFTKKSTERS